MSKFYLIGKVISVYGKDGYVKIHSYLNFSEQLKELKQVFLDFYGIKKLFVPEEIITKNKNVLLKFENFDDQRYAEVLVGRNIYAQKKDLGNLEEYHFYGKNIVGSKVIQNKNNIGLVTDVFNTPANDVMVLHTKDGKEILLPVVPEYIERFEEETMKLILKNDVDLNYAED